MKSSVRLCLGLVAVSCALVFVGCGDDDDNSTTPSSSGGQGGASDDGAPKCEELAELCHPVDPGDGPIHDCHVQSEVGNAASCEEIYVNCQAICSAVHNTGGTGGTTSGAGAGAGGVAAGGVAAGGVAAGGVATSAGAGGVATSGGAGGAGGAP